MAAYIKFDGVDGQATAKEHRSWSRIISFDQGIYMPGAASTGQTRRRGRVVLDDIIVSKKLDKASPKIAEALCKGQVFPEVLIDLTASYANSGPLTYYTYELKNVLVTSYNIQGSGRPKGVPVEEFALSFEEIKVTYTELSSKGKSKGNVEYSWKVEEGEE